jgi:hypothetical protein
MGKEMRELLERLSHEKDADSKCLAATLRDLVWFTDLSRRSLT